MNGCVWGLWLDDNSYTTSVEALEVSTSNVFTTWAYMQSGATSLVGLKDIYIVQNKDGYAMVIAVGSMYQYGYCWLSPISGECGVRLYNQNDAYFESLQLIDEQMTAAYAKAAILIGTQFGKTIINGHINTSLRASQPIHCDSGNATSTWTFLGTLQAKSGISSYIKWTASGAALPVKLGQIDFMGAPLAPLCDTAGKVVLDVGAAAFGTALTDADETLTAAQGDRSLAASTLTAVRTKTISATAALESTTLLITWGSQGSNMPIVNGGGGGGTIYTAASGSAGWIELRFDGTNWSKRRASPA
jgi:hypothetical protein